ncbi:MAG: hypothetical protein BHW55_04145 [Candidatus Melainabacteria bacterium 35_41]|jgi:hypothetical protein|nr:MAG: hypothetical protein BHW55_04145 [Candidatus Melainabacteria bacterium 35_41]
MEIRKINSTSFGNKTKTTELFEIMLRKTFKNEMATDSIRIVAKDLYPNEKIAGRYKTYAYYGNKIVNAVKEQRQDIVNDVKAINEYLNNNKRISKEQLAEYMQQYIKKYGENIDINV